MQLVLGDYIKQSGLIKHCMAQASEIINWFNNQSLALHLLYAEQHMLPESEFSHQALCLICGVITHWTSHIMLLDHLLWLKKPLKSKVVKSVEVIETAAGVKHDQITKAHEIMATTGSDGFWHDLEK